MQKITYAACTGVEGIMKVSYEVISILVLIILHVSAGLGQIQSNKAHWKISVVCTMRCSQAIRRPRKKKCEYDLMSSESDSDFEKQEKYDGGVEVWLSITGH